MLYINHTWREKSIHQQHQISCALYIYICVHRDKLDPCSLGWCKAGLCSIQSTRIHWHQQIFRTKNLLFCYSNHNFPTFFHVKAVLLDRRKHWTGRTIHGRSFCLSLTWSCSCHWIRLDGRLCNCHCRRNCYSFREMIAFIPYWFGGWQRWDRRVICFGFLSVAFASSDSLVLLFTVASAEIDSNEGEAEESSSNKEGEPSYAFVSIVSSCKMHARNPLRCRWMTTALWRLCNHKR